MKHLPFKSIYKADFEVVEERAGRITRYPHDDQLPVLLRALNLEFYGGLPARLARADQRADGFTKVSLKAAALLFASDMNAAGSDGLHLYSLADANLISRLTVVQQITEATRRGPCHWFRFYGGAEFDLEICINGKPVVFADHVLQRFNKRMPNHLGEDLTNLLLSFFGTPLISLRVGPGPAFVISYLESVLAFPYHESETEYFITTCLTIHEMNSLERALPVPAYNFHYGRAFTRPKFRHWLPTQWMVQLCQAWERKVPLPPPPVRLTSRRLTWHWMGAGLKDNLLHQGHGPGSQLLFFDNIPGPCVKELRPGEAEPRIDEVEILTKLYPQVDWEGAYAKLDAPGGVASAIPKEASPSPAERPLTAPAPPPV